MEQKPNILAWAGWQIKIPADWRPLRMEGDWNKGSMIVGHETEPAMQMRWARAGKEELDPNRWIKAAVKKSLSRPEDEQQFPLPGFSHSVMVRDYDPYEEVSDICRVWFGYSPQADLMLQLVVSSDAPKKERKYISERIVKTVRTYDLAQPIRWSVFGGSFESPAGCFLKNHRLLLGDLTLQFGAQDGSTLLLRQVYPAEHALSKRPLEKWIFARPFPEHRKYRAESEEPIIIDSFGRKIEGRCTIGSKKLPVPLGFVSPRKTLTISAHDKELDRLLIAEHDVPGEPDKLKLAKIVGMMNWQMQENE